MKTQINPSSKSLSVYKGGGRNLKKLPKSDLIKRTLSLSSYLESKFKETAATDCPSYNSNPINIKAENMFLKLKINYIDDFVFS